MTSRVLAATLALGLSAAAVAKPRAPLTNERLLDEFYAAHARRDNARTIELGQELVRRDPRSPTLLPMMVQMHAQRALWPQTIDYATRCLQILHNDYGCLTARANAHHQLARYREELADLTLVLGTGVQGLETLRTRAEVYRLVGDFAKATADYKAILEQLPGDQLVYLGLTRISVGQKNFPAALDNLKIALRAGYSRFDRLDADPALAPLRATPEYRALLAQFRPPGL